MAKKSQKTRIVAFKVEADLAQFLDKLKNKSEFIRKAILAQFSMECPLCSGSGVVARGLHEHYKPIIESQNQRPCERCQKLGTIPLSIESVPKEDQGRIEQFFRGGPFFCAECYPEIPECEDCNWHIPYEETADHFRKVHSHNH
ncbi:MAG: hypothetical protein N2112_15065 [Gemmataceae bacterium]|jgi:hypothetical protein|nr:hypothetical protein [Gemmataceae bacterium]